MTKWGVFNKLTPVADMNPATGPVLSSWKEIARFLNVDVRTCQRWERSFGLPVHRIHNSEHSRVTAYPEEIAAWRKTAFRTKNGAANGGNVNASQIIGTNGTGEGLPRRASRSKRIPKYAALALLPLAAVAAVLALLPLDRNPADFRIDGSSLVILSERGRKLWSFDTKLARIKDESFFRKAFPEKIRHIGEEGRFVTVFPKIFIRDIDQDGKSEVLFNPQTTDELNVGKIFLFDSRGEEKWVFDTNQEIQVGDQKFPPDFVIDVLDLKDVTGDGRPEILLATHCYNRAPTRFVLLDSGKRILGEYWNYGQINDFEVTDSGRDNRSEIILVGTNNEYGQACLAVLDPADMKGTSPQTPAYDFRGMSEGTARFYLRFPMTELDRLQQPRGIFVMVRIMRNAHIVAVTRDQFIWYDFDEEMNPSQITVTDRFAEAFNEAVRKGLIAPPLDRASLIKELAAGVLYYDGQSKTWVNRRSRADSPADLPNR